MGTQIAAVRVGLLAGLADLPEFTQEGPTGQIPDLSFAWRMKWERREKVWTQRARFEHVPASMRATKTFRNETGWFDLLIFVNGIGLSSQVTSERAVELGVAVEDWIATHANWHDNKVGVGITEMLVTGDGQLVEAVGETGAALAELTIPVRYKARLT